MRFLFLPFLFFTISFSYAQPVFVSGPMAGAVSRQSASIWVEAQDDVTALSLSFWPRGDENNKQTIPYNDKTGKRFNTAIFKLNGLTPGTVYDYSISGSSLAHSGNITASFKTQPDDETPDFSFLTGSCASNVLDTSIFTAMAHTPADFMVWLGDNWYLPNKLKNTEILWQGAYAVRSLPVMQPLWKAMPHYAIWDDHDYGPNNSDKAFKWKEESRRVFMHYWPNPSYGEKDKGIYTSFSYGDVNIYLLDDRWWRSRDTKAAYKGGMPNRKKSMFGDEQMDWLKDELKKSKATFNIIATGSQVLNAYNKYDCMYHYPAEYNELLDFLMDKKIQGVIFLTGDRHHSEVIRLRRNNGYPLYDITISPFTSHISKVASGEMGNPQRINGTLVEEQNYGRITVSGPKGNRKLHLDILGLKGEELAKWEITQREVSYTK